MHLRFTPWIILSLGISCAVFARVDPTDTPLAPPAEAPAYELGNVFRSAAAGIAFRGPGHCQEIRRSASDQLVQYLNDEKKWSLTVSRFILNTPTRLSSYPDEKDANRIIGGMLDSTVEKMKADVPGIEILRQDFINVGDVEVGMIAARSTLGMDTRLTQRALVRASDRLYYSFTFITPAPKEGSVEDDPETKRVVDLFGRVVDSVTLISQEKVIEEQNQRLFRTRAMLLNFGENKLRESIVPEQWWRLIRDGKDIGYSYVVEEVANDLPRAGVPPTEIRTGRGVRVGIRSRTFPEPDTQVDTESWFFVTFDRKNEVWSNLGLIANKSGKEAFGEFGTADRETKRVLDKTLAPGEDLPDGKKDAMQPPVRQQEMYTLTVTRNTRTLRGQPVERQLPPFYLPQALGHLLPRIMPLNEPKTLLFASWVSDQGEVIKRYIDIEAEQYVTLDGRRLRAIPVSDRIGLEGSPTVHYISADGKFLGSVNEESKVTILASDKATLEKIWSNPVLTRPGDVEGK